MPYTLQVSNCVTECTNSLQPTRIVHTKLHLYLASEVSVPEFKVQNKKLAWFKMLIKFLQANTKQCVY